MTDNDLTEFAKVRNTYQTKWWVYTLKLEQDMYYVGMTTNIKRRYWQHCNGKGAKITRKYKPLGIHSSKYLGYMTMSEASKYEDARAAELIAIVGKERCSGGGFITPHSKKKVGKKYKQLEDKYKLFHKEATIGLYRAKSVAKTGKHSPWSTMERQAKYQLKMSSDRI